MNLLVKVIIHSLSIILSYVLYSVGYYGIFKKMNENPKLAFIPYYGLFLSCKNASTKKKAILLLILTTLVFLLFEFVTFFFGDYFKDNVIFYGIFALFSTLVFVFFFISLIKYYSNIVKFLKIRKFYIPLMLFFNPIILIIVGFSKN